MIDRTQFRPAPTTTPRDELSMRVVEYAMAIVAIASAVLLALR
jgi:hypothetical protein